MSFTIKLDTAGLDRLLDDLSDRTEDAARPAAQAGAQVLYDAVKRNVAGLGTVTGTLARSIYQAYSKDNSGPGKAVYHISWNASKAPHGHLVEFGHIQRYKTYLGKDGKWHTAIRPEAQGKKKPSRRASQAVKDAYYVPLEGGPRQVAAQPFLRPAMASMDMALLAAEQVLLDALALSDGK